MTREAAKGNLIHAIRWNDMPKKEALEMAIEVLKYSEVPNSSYCISRQAVLDILKEKWNMFSDANDAMQESIDTIEALPPVKPQAKTGIG